MTDTISLSYGEQMVNFSSPWPHFEKSRLSGSDFDNLLLANAGSEEKSDDGYDIPPIRRTYGEFLDILGPF